MSGTPRPQAGETPSATPDLVARSPQDLERLYRAVPVGLALFDCDRRYLRLNERLAAMSGRTVGEHIGRPIQEITSPVASQLDESCRRVLETGEAVLDMEIRGPMAGESRKPIWYQISCRPVKSAGGVIEGVNAVVQDISDRKIAVETMRSWKATFDAMSDQVCLLDRDGGILQCNESMGRLLGVPNGTLIGRKCYEVMHGSAGFVNGCPYQEMMRSRKRESFELALDGNCYLVSADPIFDEQGGVAGAVHIIRDITERKRAEERLRKELKRGTTLLELYDQAPLLTDSQLYDYALDKAVDLTGSVIGFFHRVSEDQKTVILTAWNAEALKNCTATYETHYALDKAGNWVDCVRQKCPIVYNDFADSPNQKGLPEGHSPVRRFMSIPVVEDGKVRIIFGVGNKAEPYENHDVVQLQLVANELHKILKQRSSDEALRRALAEVQALKDRLSAENVYLQEEIKTTQGFDEIVGQSEPLRLTLSKIEHVARTDANVLLLGETGTGKELLARAIHDRGSRKNRPLVKVNCAALPASLIESELFGHVKGAFTGAISDKQGRFKLADGGTLFLDEIGELSLELQTKLLRVLQEGEFERIGSGETIRVDVRLIAATNRDLRRAVEQGLFRADLYYRLAVFPIEVPPLHLRRDDIPLLVWHFLGRKGAKLGKSIKTVPLQVMNTLVSYNWPGNIRELENVVERAMILSPGSTLELHESFANSVRGAPSQAESWSLADFDRTHILEVLEECAWRIKGPGNAADRLGLKPSTLRYRMKKLGIERKGQEGEG